MVCYKILSLCSKSSLNLLASLGGPKRYWNSETCIQVLPSALLQWTVNYEGVSI